MSLTLEHFQIYSYGRKMLWARLCQCARRLWKEKKRTWNLFCCQIQRLLSCYSCVSYIYSYIYIYIYENTVFTLLIWLQIWKQILGSVSCMLVTVNLALLVAQRLERDLRSRSSQPSLAASAGCRGVAANSVAARPPSDLLCFRVDRQVIARGRAGGRGLYLLKLLNLKTK